MVTDDETLEGGRLTGFDQQPDARVERRLAALRAVTDVALAYLDLDDLLDELLDRVLVAVGADTAAVLLIDESGVDLVARAARGIEEEVRQGVRIPVGVGFAGRIAAEQRSIFIDHVDETTVANPILWKTGIRAMLGVPLLAGDSTIGVLHVGTLGDRTFDDHDAQLLEVAADRIAAALRLRLLESERAAAEVLQRSLLPSVPTRLGALELAARYVPTERGGIGGDWFDVFEAPDGSVWIIIGDVAGHGLRAAVVMGRIRSALRAYALVQNDPAEVIGLTDRKVQHFEVGHMATVLVAVIRPPFTEMVISAAGHLPPVHAATVGASFVGVDVGPPLGAALTGLRWRPTRVAIEPGDVVAFYTDGLVERRDEDIEVGLERLRRSVAAGAPAKVCERVMADVIGDRVPTDDIALLAVRRSTLPGTAGHG